MFTWIKSLFTEMSAGSLLVAASMSVVIALLVALGELAASQPGADVLTLGPRGGDDANNSLLQTVASANDHKSRDVSTRGSTVSVMVPVSYR